MKRTNGTNPLLGGARGGFGKKEARGGFGTKEGKGWVFDNDDLKIK